MDLDGTFDQVLFYLIVSLLVSKIVGKKTTEVRVEAKLSLHQD